MEAETQMKHNYCTSGISESHTISHQRQTLQKQTTCTCKIAQVLLYSAVEININTRCISRFQREMTAATSQYFLIM